jgi:hypothetical protein
MGLSPFLLALTAVWVGCSSSDAPGAKTTLDGGTQSDSGQGKTDAEAMPDGEVKPRTVTGIVKYRAYDELARGATVNIGASRSVTDDDGRYTLTDIPVGPYDLELSYASVGDAASYVRYEGLRAETQNIILPGYPNYPLRSVQLNGTIAPRNPNRSITILAPTDNGGASSAGLPAGATVFNIEYVFRSPQARQRASIYALESSPQNEVTGFGVLTVDAVDGIAQTDLTLAITPIAATKALEFPADSEASARGYYLLFPRAVFTQSVDVVPAGALRNLVAPVVPGSRLIAYGIRNVGGGRQVATVADPTGSIPFVYAGAATAIAPLSGTVSASTQFEWTWPAGTRGCLEVYALPNQIFICGERTTARLPAGITLRPGPFTWRVRGVLQNTMEQVAQTDVFLGSSTTSPSISVEAP